MQRLFQFHDRFIEQTPMEIIRECGTQINWDAPMLAIRGAKGVGKSTILRQYIRSHYQTTDRSVLYCSLDNNYFADHSILDLAEQFYRIGGKHLFLDEIHKYDNWSRELKEIYDLYATEMRIVISGSSLLSLQQGNADLSRRCVNHDIQGLSFREFLRFYKGLEFPVASLEQILKEPFSII